MITPHHHHHHHHAIVSTSITVRMSPLPHHYQHHHHLHGWSMIMRLSTPSMQILSSSHSPHQTELKPKIPHSVHKTSIRFQNSDHKILQCRLLLLLLALLPISSIWCQILFTVFHLYLKFEEKGEAELLDVCLPSGFTCSAAFFHVSTFGKSTSN